MRDMQHTEIIDFIRYFTWGTLIGVEGDKPYAVELSYGFDGAYIRFNDDGTATVVIIEAKNYPNRYVPLKDFSAIGGNPNTSTNR